MTHKTSDAIIPDSTEKSVDSNDVRRQKAVVETDALQNAIFNSFNGGRPCPLDGG